MARTGRPKGSGAGLPARIAYPLSERFEKFWSLVDKRGPDECWNWKGAIGSGKNGQRYGCFSCRSTVVLAHRFSWVIRYGKLPDKPYVCHRCDNPICVNPNHLFEGTATDNNHDCASKGRVRHYGRPKIAPEKVVEIRKLYAGGGFTYKSLGNHLGLPRTQIFSALNKWKTLSLYGL